MIANTRACIALIAVGLIFGKKASSVYDHTQSKHIKISGKVDWTIVNIYDHDRGCSVAGNPGTLFDYGSNSHIQIKIHENRISGYDYASNSHFSGSANVDSVTIYDHETSSHHNFSV